MWDGWSCGTAVHNIISQTKGNATRGRKTNLRLNRAADGIGVSSRSFVPLIRPHRTVCRQLDLSWEEMASDNCRSLYIYVYVCVCTVYSTNTYSCWQIQTTSYSLLSRPHLVPSFLPPSLTASTRRSDKQRSPHRPFSCFCLARSASRFVDRLLLLCFTASASL